ncbi:MAG: ATP-binding protein, partial [Tunicatimonas sp.]|uniref:sensor histidine kinase n=1 Tax=Tunicatimonas sp. TaxID=1940096 RepID=UPI003C725CC5
VYELIRFVSQTNTELAKLLLAIKYSDFTFNFSRASHSAFKTLHPAMREIMQSYQQVKIEKEAQYQYLRLLVKHLKVGIISVKGEDEITLMNPLALAMLKTDIYHHWKNIQTNRPQLAQAIENMQDGESQLVELSVLGEKRRLSVQLIQVRLLQETYRIITLHDIEDEIDRSETQAYHRLIRILTHEIMNSVTPISSLSETLLTMLEDDTGTVKTKDEINSDYLEDLAYSLRTIQKRTNGLLSFVEDYRRLTKVPQPQRKPLAVQLLFDNVSSLMRGELEKYRITFRTYCEPNDLSVLADPQQLEQVFINLLTNSIQAIAGQPAPTISMKAARQGEKTVLEVADNGPGIPPDKLDQIFVPFFSTKEKGSGIGLSLSRHIMALHGGSIRVQSQPDVQTVFSLLFPPVAEMVLKSADI